MKLKEDSVFKTNDDMIIIESYGKSNSLVVNDDMEYELEEDIFKFRIDKAKQKRFALIGILVILVLAFMNYLLYKYSLYRFTVVCTNIKNQYQDVKVSYTKEEDIYLVYDSCDFNYRTYWSDFDFFTDAYLLQYKKVTNKDESINIKVTNASITLYPKDDKSVVVKFAERGKMTLYYLLYNKGRDFNYYANYLFENAGKGAIKKYIDTNKDIEGDQ